MCIKIIFYMFIYQTIKYYRIVLVSINFKIYFVALETEIFCFTLKKKIKILVLVIIETISNEMRILLRKLQHFYCWTLFIEGALILRGLYSWLSDTFLLFAQTGNTWLKIYNSLVFYIERILCLLKKELSIQDHIFLYLSVVFKKSG